MKIGSKVKLNENQFVIKKKLQIEMDKQKLVRIIIKDLDELKILSEEIAEIQDDTTLIVDLAINKARLLCQEIELLREYTGKANKPDIENQVLSSEFPEEDEPELTYSDPELEILHFDMSNLEEEDLNEPEGTETLAGETLVELPEEETNHEHSTLEQEASGYEPGVAEVYEEEEEEEDLDEEQLEEEQLPELELIKEEDGPELTGEEEEKEIIVYDEDLDEEDEESDLEDEEEEEEAVEEVVVEVSNLENESQQEVREIHIDELDEEDADSFRFTPLAGKSERPVMHEIPKPESTPKEKQVVGETFRKERSLNDVMSDNKVESKLTNGPISSLRASIGLNDRFLFIREIFDNNAEKYNTVIDKLDKLETIQEAVEYLKSNLSLEKNDTSMKFVDLLKRRFSK